MNEDFAKSLFEKLAKLGPNHLQSNKSKQESFSRTSEGSDKIPAEEGTPFPLNTPKNEVNTSAPGTPQNSEKSSIKKLKSLRSEEKTNSDPSQTPDTLGGKSDINSVKKNEEKGQGTENKNQTDEINAVQTGSVGIEEKKEEIAQESQEFQFQVGDDWSLLTKDQLVNLQQQAAQLAAQKAGQQILYQVVQPSPPVSRIRRETVVPVQSVFLILGLATLPFVEAFFRSVIQREKKKDAEDEFSFFVNTYLIHRPIELGEPVVATASCDSLNILYNLNPKLEEFMVGRVAGILDEARYYVNIQVFPNKFFVYTEDRTFLTPFVSLGDVNSATRPRFTKPSWLLVEKTLVKLIKNRHYQNIVKFLKYQPFSSK